MIKSGWLRPTSLPVFGGMAILMVIGFRCVAVAYYFIVTGCSLPTTDNRLPTPILPLRDKASHPENA